VTFPFFVLEVLVYAALFVSACSPILLLYLLYRDWKEGNLW